jgi:hypothetical protein
MAGAGGMMARGGGGMGPGGQIFSVGKSKAILSKGVCIFVHRFTHMHLSSHNIVMLLVTCVEA